MDRRYKIFNFENEMKRWSELHASLHIHIWIGHNHIWIYMDKTIWECALNAG